MVCIDVLIIIKHCLKSLLSKLFIHLVHVFGKQLLCSTLARKHFSTFPRLGLFLLLFEMIDSLLRHPGLKHIVCS